MRGAVFTFFNRVVVLFQSGEENWGGGYQRLFNSFAHVRIVMMPHLPSYLFFSS